MRNSLRISEAFELYRLEYIVYRNQSPKTEEMSRLAMKSLIAYAGDIYMHELTFEVVRKWKEHLSRNRSANTVRGYILKLRVVLAHLNLRGYKNVLNPELVGVPKRKTTVVSFITPDEVTDLIHAVFASRSGYSKFKRYRNRAIVALLYASGIRISELVSLDRLSIRDDGSFTIVGKRDEARLCFADSRTIEYIKQYLALRTDRDPALFTSEITNSRLSKSTIQLVFRNAKTRGGFEKAIHPHVMRHSFATNLLRNNTNLIYVRDFLGHKSVQTTEQYTHVVNEDLKRIYTEKHSF